MKAILKIIFSIIIIFFIIIAEELTLGLGIKTWLNYQKTYVVKIDTSFFTNEMKNNLLEIVEPFKKTSLRYTEIINDEIYYYDLNHNSISGDILLGFNIKNILEKWKINKAFYSIDKKSKEIDYIFFKLNYNDLYLVYRNKKENIKEGDIIWIGRVEKIIDNSWYISKECNRNICPESQG